MIVICSHCKKIIRCSDKNDKQLAEFFREELYKIEDPIEFAPDGKTAFCEECIKYLRKHPDKIKEFCDERWLIDKGIALAQRKCIYCRKLAIEGCNEAERWFPNFKKENCKNFSLSAVELIKHINENNGFGDEHYYNYLEQKFFDLTK